MLPSTQLMNLPIIHTNIIHTNIIHTNINTNNNTNTNTNTNTRARFEALPNELILAIFAVHNTIDTHLSDIARLPRLSVGDGHDSAQRHKRRQQDFIRTSCTISKTFDKALRPLLYSTLLLHSDAPVLPLYWRTLSWNMDLIDNLKHVEMLDQLNNRRCLPIDPRAFCWLDIRAGNLWHGNSFAAWKRLLSTHREHALLALFLVVAHNLRSLTIHLRTDPKDMPPADFYKLIGFVKDPCVYPMVRETPDIRFRKWTSGFSDYKELRHLRVVALGGHESSCSDYFFTDFVQRHPRIQHYDTQGFGWYLPDTVWRFPSRTLTSLSLEQIDTDIKFVAKLLTHLDHGLVRFMYQPAITELKELELPGIVDALLGHKDTLRVLSLFTHWIHDQLLWDQRTKVKPIGDLDDFTVLEELHMNIMCLVGAPKGVRMIPRFPGNRWPEKWDQQGSYVFILQLPSSLKVFYLENDMQLGPDSPALMSFAARCNNVQLSPKPDRLRTDRLLPNLREFYLQGASLSDPEWVRFRDWFHKINRTGIHIGSFQPESPATTFDVTPIQGDYHWDPSGRRVLRLEN